MVSRADPGPNAEQSLRTHEGKGWHDENGDPHPFKKWVEETEKKEGGPKLGLIQRFFKRFS